MLDDQPGFFYTRKGKDKIAFSSDAFRAFAVETLGVSTLDEPVFRRLLRDRYRLITEPQLTTTIVGRGVENAAHVITKYGHGFREAYLEIGDFIRSLKSRPPIGAFTATATPEMKGEIKKSLGLRHPTEFIGGVTRKNLELRVCEVGSGLKSPSEKAVIELRKRELILKELEEVDKGRVIIYCNTVNKVKKLHHFLRNKGIRAGKYHGRGMSFQKKRKALKEFVKGKLDVIVATSAFGLGVDIPDVRLVIHHSPPVGLDDYVQEAGRAGRDGKKSACLLLWHNSDFHINRGLIQKTKNSISGAALKQKMASLDALGAYAREDRTCRWQQIRSFFGEDEGKRCKKRCDNCRNR